MKKLATTLLLTLIICSPVDAARNKSRSKARTFPEGRDYWEQVTPPEKQEIDYIINTLAEKPTPSLLLYKSSLDGAGKKIDHVHPLRFLLVIFSDEKLKVGMRNIRKKGMVWKDFSKNTADSLAFEAARGNLTDDQLADFSARLGIDEALMADPIHKGDYVQFMDSLIKNVPRDGDPSRYDM